VGVCGAGIFEDDVAADVQLQWLDLTSQGMPQEDVTARLIAGLGSGFIPDSDDGPVFWIALAALQLESDALDAQVAQQAAQAIPLNAARWRQEADADTVAQRDRVLDELRNRLSPQATEGF